MKIKLCKADVTASRKPVGTVNASGAPVDRGVLSGTATAMGSGTPEVRPGRDAKKQRSHDDRRRKEFWDSKSTLGKGARW